MNIRAFLLAASLPLAACGAEPAAAPPLAGARIGGPFALIDEDGRRVTERDYAGRWRVVYFGYTFCPDVCPTDAQNIGAGLRRYEAEAGGSGAPVVPLFVTVDPARDTPAVLKAFTAAFHPRMVGLTGSADAIAQVAKAYGVYYRRGEATPGGGYLVDHQNTAYLMDPVGKPVALMPLDQGPQAVAAELAKWVR